MYIETNLSKIRRIAAEREDENYRFRRFLKSKDSEKVDDIVHRLHKKIVPLIDCTTCGNCCYCLRLKINDEDINVLAHLENISPEEYQTGYCEEDEEDICLKDVPCRYLDGKKCRIYENRPQQCREFPYTNKKDFIFRLLGMIRFYETCPIVFNLMEKLKDEFRFYRR
jgi:Fe-S-cluster containining protein